MFEELELEADGNHDNDVNEELCDSSLEYLIRKWCALSISVRLLLAMAVVGLFYEGSTWLSGSNDGHTANAAFSQTSHASSVANAGNQIVVPHGINSLPSSIFDPSQHPNWRLKTLSIEDIRVGMRVPAFNPEVNDRGTSDLALTAKAYGVPVHSLRTFTLHFEDEDGEVSELKLVRPASWAARSVILASVISGEIEYDQALAFQDEQWQALLLDGWNELGRNPLDQLVGLSSGQIETVQLALPVVSLSPVSAISTVLDRFGSQLTNDLIDQIDAMQLVESVEQDILSGDAVGAELYVELAELGLEGWATLAAIEPARITKHESEFVDPATHRLLRLVAKREDGSTTRIELIRSADWIRENLGEVGAEWANGGVVGKLRLDIPELRLNDYADVISIEVCPPVKSGPGEVVTATYHTDRAKVIDLSFESSSEPIGTTAEHPFWSVSRQEFVPAGKLELGEQVVTISGQTTRLSDISPRDGPVPVYNFEVAGQHTYFVSKDGVLVHNAGKGVYLGNFLGTGKSKLAKNSGKVLTPRGPKKGLNGPHNQTIKAWGDLVVAGGGRIVAGGKRFAEKLVPVPSGGLKSGRRPDIWAMYNGQKVAIQVGRTTAKGAPVPREVEAMQDLILAGFRVIFVPFGSAKGWM